MQLQQHVTLPVPPSANRYWRQGRGRLYLSPEGRAYKKEAARIARDAGMTPILSGRAVSVTVRWYRARKSGDLDNRLKIVLDALQDVAYYNDAQLVEIRAVRFDDKANPRVEVTVTEAAV